MSAGTAGLGTTVPALPAPVGAPVPASVVVRARPAARTPGTGLVRPAVRR